MSGRLGELGLGAIVGPELEFYLLEEDESCDRGWQRYADATGNVYVVGRKGDPQGILLTMLRYLRDADLQVTAANHEFSGGQFEINLNHSELVDAADRAFRMKSAVQEIARHEGMLATFMAKPFNDEGGSGFHLHVSLVDEAGTNVFGDPDGQHGLSDIGRSAIAGVLRHAPALAAILNPTINSYKRFGPDTLAPWLIDWGLDNRSAMVRIPPERGRLGPDGGAPGRRNGEPLPRDGRRRRGDRTSASATSSSCRCTARGLRLRPRERADAAAVARQRRSMRWRPTPTAEVLGEFFVESFLSYKRNEVERFSRFVTDWEFREYAYHL